MKELRSNKQSLKIFVLAGLVIFSLLWFAKPAAATPPSGLTGVPVASGALPEAIRVKYKVGESGFTNGTDVKKIVMMKFTLAPGGTFGWHRHGGPVWAVVTSGTFLLYSGDDPTCTPQVYGAGSVFLDPGDHTHLGRNETDNPVEIYATFMLPEGGLPRLDAPNPGLCNIN